MRSALFYGCGTALVTPFRGSRIDFDAFEGLIDRQLAAGIDALIVLGTTGEPASLAPSERAALLECAVSRCARRAPILAGTGSNDTRTAIRLSQEAQRLGADALLVVTPYYNRASRDGLKAHYLAIADAVDLPILLYNVPGRTGVNLPADLIAQLARHPNLRGVKDASGSLRQLTDLAALADGLAIYGGNDDQACAAMALGARGIISVAANIVPEAMERLTALSLSGDTRGSLKEQLQLMPLIRALFAEVSPIPVKAALAMMGFISDELRLPLTPLGGEKRAALKEALEALGLLPE